MEMKKKLLSAAIASVLMLVLVSTTFAYPPGFDPSLMPPGFTKYKTWIYVTAESNPAKLGSAQTITTFLVPPPPMNSGIGGNGIYIVPVPYTNITIYLKTPGGTTTNLGNFTTGDSGACWTVVVPDELGEYVVTAAWPGDDLHQAATSQETKFEVTEEGSSMYDYPQTAYPAPNQYWETPVSAEFREWTTLVGPWYKSSGFNGSNCCFQEYSTAPSTAHVLWKYKAGSAGLIGGIYGQFGYNRAEYLPPNQHTKTFMDGLFYYQVGGMNIPTSTALYCVDAKTGKEVWRLQPYVGGAVFGIPACPMYGADSVLSVTPRWQATLYTMQTGGKFLLWFDAQTGAVVRNVTVPAYITNAGTVELTPYGGAYVYFAYASRTVGNLTKWNMWKEKIDAGATAEAGIVATFQEGIEWTVELGNRAPGIITDNAICSTTGDVGFPFVGYDLTTGALLYNVTREYNIASSATAGYGKVFAMCSDGYWRAWSARTGLEVWKSTYPESYPWGYFTVYNSAAAYGNFYGASYSGYYNCFDAETGENKWNYFAGKSTETSMGHLAYWGAPAVADGKIFVSEGSQHPVSSPVERGANLVCLNATTGEVIWKFSLRDGAADAGSKAIAEGKLLICDGYTGYELCFTKGQTATTISAPQTSAALGTSVVIRGTVKDLSSANVLAPACVSDASMTPWMEYCNINGPKPTNATGVEVTLSVLDSNNNYRDIATVTTDPYNDGFYTFAWTPEIPGAFTVYATFKGTDSYWPSNAASSFVVHEAPETPAGPAAPVDYGMAIYGILAAVIVAIVIGLVAVFLTLRKR